MLEYILYTLALCIPLAFSKEKRTLIKRKFHHRCCHRNQDCVGQLECCHLNHNKNSSEYYNVDNAILLCTYHHFLDHLNRTDNGLNKAQNDWACDEILKRVNKYLGR